MPCQRYSLRGGVDQKEADPAHVVVDSMRSRRNDEQVGARPVENDALLAVDRVSVFGPSRPACDPLEIVAGVALGVRESHSQSAFDDGRQDFVSSLGNRTARDELRTEPDRGEKRLDEKRV